MDEYSTEKFIEQYEHIKKLQLLPDDQLSLLKKKRTKFEVALKSAEDIKAFMDYLQYELVLMHKFKSIKYDNEIDGTAILRAFSAHVRSIFRRAIKRFPEDHKLWCQYIQFLKKHFPSNVTGVYQEMLSFHHSIEDYKEAAQHEMERKNHYVATTFLVQGMNSHKEPTEIVLLYIECLLRQAEEGDKVLQEKTLNNVIKSYNKCIKNSGDVKLLVELLRKVQGINYARTLQKEIFNDLIKFSKQPEFWNFMAVSYLDGHFYEGQYVDFKPEDIPFETRLIYALSIYKKALDCVDDKKLATMYELCLSKLEELYSVVPMNDSCGKCLKLALEETIKSGFDRDCLPEKFFFVYFQNKLMNQASSKELEEVITKGSTLYSHSPVFYEIAFRYFYSQKDFTSISTFLLLAVKNYDGCKLDLIRLLCNVCSKDQERAIKCILEIVEKYQNTKFTGQLQAYLLDYCAAANGIEKTRKMYHEILNSKNAIFLTHEFFQVMINLETNSGTPDHKIIQDSYERSTRLFGRDNPQVSF